MSSCAEQTMVLAVPMEAGWARAIARGAAAAARQSPPWIVQTSSEKPAALEALRQLRPRPSGVVVPVTSPRQEQECRQLRRLGMAVVNVGFLLPGSRLPHVGNDDRAIGRMAAEHLQQCGLGRFGFAGCRGLRVAALRQEGFVQALEEAGYEVPVWDGPAHRRGPGRTVGRGSLAAWLRGLPRPVGVCGWCDAVAAQVIRTCQALGLRVPEDVAVVGVDNDQTVCELCTPPLSSVAVSMERIGFEAAMLLKRLAGRPGPRPRPRGGGEEAMFVPPVGVVPRRSSEMTAVADQDVAASLEWIRRNASRGVGVEELVAATLVSRSTLQRRFRQVLGRTPAEELRRVRLRRARQLLAETELPLAEVARQAGFARVEYLHAVFHRAAGMTPGAYRRQFRRVMGAD